MTIHEIANALGISIATVSKALNGASDVSETTRKRICEYAQSVGFYTRKARTVIGRVALLWDTQPSPPLLEIGQAFRAAAESARYVVTEEKTDEGFPSDEFFVENRLFGAFLLGAEGPLPPQLAYIRHPVVLANGYLTGNPLVAGVESDLLHGTQEAVNYLLALGHERIAFLCEGESACAERFAGYVNGLLGHGLKLEGELVFWGKNCVERAMAARGFTAAVCASDVLARKLFERAGSAGMRLPAELSIVGGDDVHSPADQAFTGIRQNFTELGRSGFLLLESLMKGLPAHRATIGCTLVTGTSTAYIKSDPSAR